MADEASPTSQTLTPIVDQAPSSVDATIDSSGLDGTTSSCNNSNVVKTSDGEKEKSLEYAEELMEKGSKANKEDDYTESTDCFSRALEIRVAHYGELAPECVRAYYKYGCALLYKAQEESDPLVSGAVSKKKAGAEEGSAKGAETSAPSNAKEGTSNISEEGRGEEDQEEDDDEGSDGEEDESDLDLAWKMLDVARAISEKEAGDTMEKVDILSALAEVALEREDVETSLSDYLKALAMLERLAEPDSRHIAELNFRICLCLEIGSKGEEAIPYCQKAILVCKSRLQRLAGELETSSTSVNPESAGLLGRQSSSASQTTDSVADKEKEIEILTGLSSDLEKKLEDLQQPVSNPSSILSDILGMMAAKGKGGETSGSGGGGLTSSRIGAANSSGFESPTVSTAHTNGDSGVTHLGVVGRGVKRVNMNSAATESTAAKKPAVEPSSDNGGSA